LREELRELQLDLDDDDAGESLPLSVDGISDALVLARALLLEPTPSRLAQPYAPDLSDSDESDESDSEVSSSASSQVAGNGVSGSATKSAAEGSRFLWERGQGEEASEEELHRAAEQGGRRGRDARVRYVREDG
jgi:hypothetical protein